MSTADTTIEVSLPVSGEPIDQAQALLTACGALVTGDLETSVRSMLAAIHRPRHREHTAALLAVVAELADLMELPPHEVPWALLAGTDTPEIVFESVRKAMRGGKWFLTSPYTWVQFVQHAIRAMLEAYCDDEQGVTAVINGARMRLYAR